MSIVERLRADERWALRRMVHRSRCREEVRRALAILRLAEGQSVSEVARLVEAARSSVYRWLEAFRRDGVSGLRQGRRGRGRSTVNRHLVEALVWLLERPPEAFGYLRSTWSSELMAKALAEQFSLRAHPSTLRRLLVRIDWVWRRARPTLNRRDPNKAEKLARIEAALGDADARTEVFYVDEADIDLNPRIGCQWTRRGEQPAVVTPGQNKKVYLAGALHAHTGHVLWRGGEGKNSALFVELLEHLRRRYRRARRIVLILDNYIIHKSRETRRWLAKNPKFTLLFQPVYHPWVNRIERLWKAMHDTVTRNHRCRDLGELIERVVRFLAAAQPFPGAGHGLAHAEAGVAEFGSAI